eukprot:7992170-Lingulodinium_polyedra.AAC.1
MLCVQFQNVMFDCGVHAACALLEMLLECCSTSVRVLLNAAAWLLGGWLVAARRLLGGGRVA